MDKISDLGNGKKVFLSYLNDDNKVISGYVDLLSYDAGGFVVFKTDKNLIRIPPNRVLKIKEEIESDSH